MYTAVPELWNYLRRADKPIVLYGMGNGADKIVSELNRLGVKISGLFATDSFVRDKYFHGLKLTTYDELKRKYVNMIVLLCFGTARSDVLEKIKRIAAEQELLVPDVPVCGTTLFNSTYAAENREALSLIFSLLADEASRRTFESIVKFKLSGRPEDLFRIEADAAEPGKSFFNLGDSESYLDLGAYNGDTVLKFASEARKYDGITAIEPSPKSFERLKKNTADLDGVRLINACISDKCGTAEFSSHNGRGGKIGHGAPVKAVTVDSLNTAFTLIKADVEGAEIAAIRGAAATIATHRPRLQIACYHRTEDITAIPREVFALRDDYRLYMRHFPCLPAWDTYYYFV